ncbi:MAG: hypothetical protein Q9162_003072 [Coniocarpon cinnabarinum]
MRGRSQMQKLLRKSKLRQGGEKPKDTSIESTINHSDEQSSEDGTDDEDGLPNLDDLMVEAEDRESKKGTDATLSRLTPKATVILKTSRSFETGVVANSDTDDPEGLSDS